VADHKTSVAIVERGAAPMARLRLGFVEMNLLLTFALMLSGVNHAIRAENNRAENKTDQTEKSKSGGHQADGSEGRARESDPIERAAVQQALKLIPMVAPPPSNRYPLPDIHGMRGSALTKANYVAFARVIHVLHDLKTRMEDPSLGSNAVILKWAARLHQLEEKFLDWHRNEYSDYQERIELRVMKERPDSFELLKPEVVHRLWAALDFLDQSPIQMRQLRFREAKKVLLSEKTDLTAEGKAILEKLQFKDEDGGWEQALSQLRTKYPELDIFTEQKVNQVLSEAVEQFNGPHFDQERH
jgi:hypothetical protein